MYSCPYRWHSRRKPRFLRALSAGRPVGTEDEWGQVMDFLGLLSVVFSFLLMNISLPKKLQAVGLTDCYAY